MEIHCGSDHRGFGLKQQLIAYLSGLGHNCIDHGCHSEERCDYPLYGEAVGRAVLNQAGSLGIVICGSGIGISIAANKVPGIRCCTAWSEYVAEYGRRHNHANVLAFASDLQTFTQVKRCLDAYLAAEPEGGRHALRVAMLDEMDAR